MGKFSSSDLKGKFHVDGGDGYAASITSMIIPDGFEVKVYDDDYYKGRNEKLIGPISVDLRGNYWNDRIKSIEVSLAPHITKMSFDWDLIAAGSGLIETEIESFWEKET